MFELDQDPAGRRRVDECYQRSFRARSRLVVDQPRAVDLETRERAADVVDTQRDVVKARPTLVDVLCDRRPFDAVGLVPGDLCRQGIDGRVEADLVDQLFNSGEKRLARALLLLANFGKEGKPEPVVAKISQETLAAMIGTTRSRVSSFMNKFRQLGFIDYNGKLEVHSSLLNVVLLDEPHIRT